MLPIQYPRVYEMYKQHVASFWTPEDFKRSSNVAHTVEAEIG